MAAGGEQPQVFAEEQPMISQSEDGRAAWRAQAYVAKGAVLLTALAVCGGVCGLARYITGGSALTPTSSFAMTNQLQIKSADVQSFSLTDGMYTDLDEHASACTGEFGLGARVADWDMDLGPLSPSEVDSLMDRLNISTTFNQKNYFVQEAGRQHYGGKRAYFFERHDGKPPGNWLVHDQHGSITLGSWFGISGPVLCVRRAVGGTVSDAVGGAVSHAVDASRGVLCKQISAKRVFDVQWSGNVRQTTLDCYGFDAPFHPHKGRTIVDREADYYSLVQKADGKFSLRQYGADGTLKETLPDGRVALASQEAIFYIIDGWYGTVITSMEHQDGDRASFRSLTADPSPEAVRRDCEAPEKQLLGQSCITICGAEGTELQANCASAFKACASGCSMTDFRCGLGCNSANTRCVTDKASAYAKCMQRCVVQKANMSVR
mmetsp:Transcript_63544/g.200752  ORF Transcript_63544/g.200752 Transcript_63544/m.200752 type:complete len:434 (+) Transcript_63544:77-1378(+)